MKKYLLLTTAAIALAAGGAFTAHTATQGTSGATSTGTFGVSLTVASNVKVSNLTDVDFGTYAGADITENSTFCAYFSQPGKVNLTLDSTATPGTFQVSDGVTPTPDVIPYTIELTDKLNNVTPVVAGTAINGVDTGNNTADDDCVTAGADNEKLAFSILNTDMTGKPNGTYTDTVSVIASPGF